MWFADEFDECSYYDSITKYCPHCDPYDEDKAPFGTITFSSSWNHKDKIYECCEFCYNDFMKRI